MRNGTNSTKVQADLATDTGSTPWTFLIYFTATAVGGGPAIRLQMIRDSDYATIELQTDPYIVDELYLLFVDSLGVSHDIDHVPFPWGVSQPIKMIWNGSTIVLQVNGTTYLTVTSPAVPADMDFVLWLLKSYTLADIWSIESVLITSP